MTVMLLLHKDMLKEAGFVGTGAIRRARSALRSSRALAAKSEASIAGVTKSKKDLVGLNKQLGGMDPKDFGPYGRFMLKKRTGQTEELLKQMKPGKRMGSKTIPGSKTPSPAVATVGKKSKRYFTKKQFRGGVLVGAPVLAGSSFLAGKASNKSQQRFNQYYQ